MLAQVVFGVVIVTKIIIPLQCLIAYSFILKPNMIDKGP